MNELSLFSGAGGGLLGTMLLGFRPIGYVEWIDYCQRVIAARIRDGILPDAPIFGDIKTFIDSGCAELYRGVTDVLSAGFPCQPFSVAGKQKGADDERNMWPATATVIGIVKPRFVLLENVPGVRTYLPVVVRDLRRLGYEVSRPLILGADDVGAPHRRKRVWIFAHTIGHGGGSRRPKCEGQQRRIAPFGAGFSSDSVGGRSEQGHTDPREPFTVNGGGYWDAPHAPSREAHTTEPGGLHAELSGKDWDAADTDETGRGEQRRPESVREEQPAPECGLWAEQWPEVATRLCRVDDGVASRVDRLKALGNGQVPRVVATAWRLLTR